MPKLVTKFKYLKPNARQPRGGYAKYIATREGVEKLDDSQKFAPATAKQRQLIDKLLHDFPDSKEMFEYDDYLQKQTVGAASEFISRTLEDNAGQVMASENQYFPKDKRTKPLSFGKYADYIATRPRAERFGSHGLFTDDGVQVNLQKVSAELNGYTGNVYTIIISLHREDAARLGYDTGSRWRDMLRTQTQALAENLKIPMEHLKWFAAFHNESHHPHVHLIAYSTVPNEGYLSKQGVHNLRSEFAKDIFAQDLHCIYEQQTEYRDELRLRSKEHIAEIVEQINSGLTYDPQLQQMLLSLADRLKKHKGKKVYGYLSAGTKKLVDDIVDRIGQDRRITALYDLWYQQRDEIFKTYSREPSDRLPLSQNAEFKPIRNAVVREALNIMQRDSETEIAPDEHIDVDSVRKAGTWWTAEYKEARSYLYGQESDYAQARNLLLAEAESGNGFAMYDLGRMHLTGLGCAADENEAQEWFRKAYHAFMAEESRAESPAYLQYRIGKLYAMGYGVAQDYASAAAWYTKAVSGGDTAAAYALGCLLHQGQGAEQDDSRAFLLFRMAAEDENKPNAYAAYELGRMCKGGIGTQADSSTSESWYRRAYHGFRLMAYTSPDDRLYYRLGQMNLTGTGTAPDIRQAMQYFEKAAQLGNPYAEYQLGKLYLHGEGVAKDEIRAVEYLTLSASHGNAYAQALLDSMHSRTSTPIVDCTLRLLQQTAQIFQERFRDLDDQRLRCVDRKLQSQIAEKKLAQGQKLGG